MPSLSLGQTRRCTRRLCNASPGSAFYKLRSIQAAPSLIPVPDTSAFVIKPCFRKASALRSHSTQISATHVHRADQASASRTPWLKRHVSVTFGPMTASRARASTNRILKLAETGNKGSQTRSYRNPSSALCGSVANAHNP